VLKAFKKYFGNQIDAEDVQKIFNIVDVSGSGEIEFSEFLMVCIPQKIILSN